MEFPGAQGQDKGLAIASLVCGILSLVCLTVLGPIAVVLGVIAIGKEKGDPVRYGGKGLAIGGIATGSIATLLLFVVIIFIFGSLLAR
jgi:Domain of unknown function (DUF4190)